MAVTLLGEISDARQFTITYDQAGRDQKNATRSFKVESSVTNENESVVLAANGLPQRWAPHPADAYTFVKSRSAKRFGPGDHFWRVDISYDNQFEDPEGDGQPPAADPRQRPITWEYRFDKYQKVAEGANPSGATFGGALSNSAGEPYDPPLLIDDSRPTVVFTELKAVDEFDFSTLAEYVDGVNDAPVWGKEARTLKIDSITASKIRVENEVRIRELTYVVQYRPDTWNAAPLDQGSYYLNFSDEPVSFEDDNGQPYIYLLDGNGARGDTDDPKFGDHVVYPEVNFSNLNLPDPFS